MNKDLFINPLSDLILFILRYLDTLLPCDIDMFALKNMKYIYAFFIYLFFNLVEYQCKLRSVCTDFV